MLPDILADDLRVVFVGTSVGETSAARRHYYADPSNRFWDLLEATSLTSNAGLTSECDHAIVRHGLGLTDLVKSRAASSDSRLVAGDYDVPGFLARMNARRPQIIAFNGAKSAHKVARHLGNAPPAEGPIAWRVAGAWAYRLASSSGANATGGYLAKQAKWVAFGQWVRGLERKRSGDGAI